MPNSISAAELESLFDALPDVVFFVKDALGRYTHANLTLVRRLGLRRRDEVIGRGVAELFPATMGGSYAAQDRRVLAGETIADQLEVHIFPNRAPGWCLTRKQPLRERGRVRGIVGISRDLGRPDTHDATYARLRRVMDFMQQHCAETVRMSALAALAELSLAQLERHFRRVLQITPQQALTRLRIEAALRRLDGDDTIAAIGQACGFADQSAFARQFKVTVGMTPRAYRQLVRVHRQQRQ